MSDFIKTKSKIDNLIKNQLVSLDNLHGKIFDFIQANSNNANNKHYLIFLNFIRAEIDTQAKTLSYIVWELDKLHYNESIISTSQYLFNALNKYKELLLLKNEDEEIPNELFIGIDYLKNAIEEYSKSPTKFKE